MRSDFVVEKDNFTGKNGNCRQNNPRAGLNRIFKKSMDSSDYDYLFAL